MSRGVTAASSSQSIAGNATIARLGTVIVSHTAVDTYAAFVPPLLGLLEVRCHLEPAQSAWLIGIGSLSSGLSQPVAAWLSDHLDSRIFGAVGLMTAAVCLSCIGRADSFGSLLILFIIGTIGVGMFHPIGASSAGELSDQLPSKRRSLGISVFFVAGMAGGIMGAIIATRIAARDDGFDLLQYLMIPGLVMAGALHLAIRRVGHRHHEHHQIRFPDHEIRKRWFAVGLLYVGNAMRFTVNMAMLYLFVRWAQSVVRDGNADQSPDSIAMAATPITGNLNALLILGMALGGLVAGALIRQGREKWPLVVVPIALSPAVMLFGFATPWQGYVLAVASGIGFASMIPVTLSLAQRLLPHRTSLASGLMLGGAWSIALAGPPLAELCLGRLGLGIEKTFVLTGVLLAVSGLLALPLSSALVRDTAESLLTE